LFNTNNAKVRFIINQLYKIVKVSIQASHQYAQLQQHPNYLLSHLVKEADKLWHEHTGCGIKKLYYTLNADFIVRYRFSEVFIGRG
jgi:hypothetical protein